ncbi:hypothetical protein ASD56_13835 [Microbacterium sp. Root166]|uniref:DUF1648 domain-containing protein n=1 Tax=Microbacterium sp. Root166 TaxID=1736478 RepID=UPI0006FBFD2D|nr:DUF1648 domain-containing protein [Microbacterium sp. Root166]KQZ83366.1 hypothetical protein ASD56_13835 [Microbacterium sp. Root166]
MTDLVRGAYRRFLLIGLVLPLVVAVIAVALQLWWLPSLPDPAAIHWSGSGPDGFAPPWTYPVLTAALAIGLPLLLAGIAHAAARAGEWGPNLRFLGAVSLGTSLGLSLALTWSVAMQRGLTDAADAPGVGIPLLAALGLGLVAGVIGWFAQPGVSRSNGTAASGQAAPIVLAEGERAVWLRTTTMSRGGMAALLAGVLALAGAVFVTALAGPDRRLPWILAGALVVFLLAVLSTTVFRVRVDEQGLTVRSGLGVPRFRVPLGDVATAEVSHVQALAEFGGIGIRSVPGRRFGVVLRSGDALRVHRVDGREFVVTVDDATTGAALLTALAARERAAVPGTT